MSHAIPLGPRPVYANSVFVLGTEGECGEDITEVWFYYEPAGSDSDNVEVGHFTLSPKAARYLRERMVELDGGQDWPARPETSE